MAKALTRSDLNHFGSAEAAFDDLVGGAYSDDAMMFDRENRNANGNRRHVIMTGYLPSASGRKTSA